jgi:hypothetical protein
LSGLATGAKNDLSSPKLARNLIIEIPKTTLTLTTYVLHFILALSSCSSLWSESLTNEGIGLYAKEMISAARAIRQQPT